MTIHIGDLPCHEDLDGSQMSDVQGGIIIVCSPTRTSLQSQYSVTGSVTGASFTYDTTLFATRSIEPNPSP